MSTSTAPASRLGVRKIAVSGILSALVIAMTLTPFGYIMIPGLNIQVTLLHVPVLVAAIVEGPVVGLFVGLMFGLSSLYTAIITPSVIAFAFLNPLVSILPRVLFGLAAWYLFKGIDALMRGKARPVAIGIAAAVATLLHTTMVLGAIWILYAQRFMDAIGQGGAVARIVFYSIAATNAPPEVLVAVVITVPVAMAVLRFKKATESRRS